MNLFELYKVLNENQQQNNNFLATVIEGENTGSRYFMENGEILAQYGNRKLTEEELQTLKQSEESGIVETENGKFFMEALKQPAHLVICGAGHVAQQVILLAAKVGFKVTVLEDRVSFAGEARRAGADQVICDSFENALKQIPGSENTYFLVVTRGHRYDHVCLSSILRKPHCYVGMMASRGRSALLKKQMEEEGFDRTVLDEIHTPVGMQIHAETPEEIAVSIVSELIKEKNSIRKTSGYDTELMEYLTGQKEPDMPKALATIVARRGSAPRGIGTKMLVLADGRIIGTIGGGCMESEVQHLCLRMLHEEKAEGKLFTVDMTASQAEEEGLVCGGTIRVFLEVLGE
ncbi:XdhC family protein [Blautia sp. MSJ-19]|uniref:XdhC family protein n=1 Tax=Blautia sp. MSJ-19 TaxID=2841517 RepID=UPI001C0F1218|nr:XdhC/CoxI family protein [Blautia sp. MSJ-19]MBU5480461.1 XdhC family protein [Blautia sp. MSJ-19]